MVCTSKKHAFVQWLTSTCQLSLSMKNCLPAQFPYKCHQMAEEIDDLPDQLATLLNSSKLCSASCSLYCSSGRVLCTQLIVHLALSEVQNEMQLSFSVVYKETEVESGFCLSSFKSDAPVKGF